MDTPPLTEKLLIETGGWPTFKQAKALRERGGVLEAAWEPPLLTGRVREGDREYRAGLKIVTRIRIDNLCTCRISRGAGLICAHSIAVGIGALNPAGPGNPKLQAPNPKAPEPATTAAPLPFVERSDAPARLRVVLPPNLALAWEKGQVIVALEMAEGTSRPPIGLDAALAKTRPLPLRPEDFAVLAGLSAALNGEMPRGATILNRPAASRLLELLRGHPGVSLARGPVLMLPAEPFRAVLAATPTPDGGTRVTVRWPTGADTQPLVPREPGVAAYLLRPTARQLLAVAPGLPAPYAPLFAGITLASAEADAFFAAEWPKLATWFDLTDERPAAASTAVPATVPAPTATVPPPKTFSLDLEGSLNELTAHLTAIYQTLGDEWPANPGLPNALRMPPGARRDRPAEDLALARLAGAGFSWPDAKTGRAILRGQDHVLRFFATNLPALRRDWRVTVGARFEHVTKDIATVTPRVEVRGGGSGTDWFELDLAMTVPGKDGRPAQTFSPAEIQRLLQMGKSSVRLNDGRLAVLPAGELDDLSAVLQDIEPDQRRPGSFRIRKFHAGYLDAALERFGPDALQGWDRWKTGAGALVAPPPPNLPPVLAETLRPYQADGVRWLHFLAANGLGGILADEMGLGKTLQALAFLTTLDRRGAPSLVVCPSSLLENWRREAARFTPELRTLVLQGGDRGAYFKDIPTTDLVITSYALLRRDVDRYGDLPWAAAILDEAHHIKNPDSQSAAAACSLKAKHRLVLTGTPLENSVRDLWSIMRFALPGYLGIRTDFRERYETPISRPGDPLAADARERLARRMRPFLLRRRKRDVAKELPDKLEQVAYCELTPTQREVYRGLLAAGRQKVEEAMMDRKGRGQMGVLTAILRLRQACCDLRLLGLENPSANGTPDGDDSGEPGDAVPETSAKLGLLNELLEEIREGGHRVLIFSQFVTMLKLLSEHLTAAKTPFAYLDGSTKDRPAAVDRFQNDPACTAFLISTKAGGVGLNLTAADTVIHFDPWWNPAVEQQATDRAHRIGQTRVVTAYKLIARGTVEDKILELQRRKRETTDALLDPDGAGGSTGGDGLNLEEMRALMAE